MLLLQIYIHICRSNVNEHYSVYVCVCVLVCTVLVEIGNTAYEYGLVRFWCDPCIAYIVVYSPHLTIDKHENPGNDSNVFFLVLMA